MGQWGGRRGEWKWVSGRGVCVCGGGGARGKAVVLCERDSSSPHHSVQTSRDSEDQAAEGMEFRTRMAAGKGVPEGVCPTVWDYQFSRLLS